MDEIFTPSIDSISDQTALVLNENFMEVFQVDMSIHEVCDRIVENLNGESSLKPSLFTMCI